MSTDDLTLPATTTACRDGGRVTFTAFRASTGLGGWPGGRAGPMIFALAQPAVADGSHLPDTEVLRFEPDGSVYVRGEQVDSNMTVYANFRAWLEQANPGPGEGYDLVQTVENGVTTLTPRLAYKDAS